MRFIYSKTFLVFFICLCLVVVLGVLNNFGYLGKFKSFLLYTPKPFVFVLNRATTNAKFFLKTIYSLKETVSENLSLREKIYNLQKNLVELESEKRENAVLRKELNFYKNTKHNLVNCPVLAQNAFGLSDSIVLGCGSSQGVENGLAVVSQGYLVGKIVYAEKNTSTVLLANSSRFTADALVSKTGQKALVVGSFGSGMVLDQIPQDQELQKGWLVVTAGINEKISKDILIGEVGEVISSPNDLHKKVTLTSPVEFKILEMVFVIK